MTRFQLGPAHGQALSLYRTPFLLRVVERTRPGNDTCDETGWDALDQVHDEPRANERLHAYVLIDGPIRAFVRSSRPGAGGLQVLATYKWIPEQPTEDDMRTRSRWAAWCKANAARLGWKAPA